MEASQKSPSRKKFLLWTAAILSSVTVLKFLPGTGTKKKKSDTVKMLTQDGRLVEIDRDMISGSKRKITDPELKSWVKNN
jgi:hypothetical protein